MKKLTFADGFDSLEPPEIDSYLQEDDIGEIIAPLEGGLVPLDNIPVLTDDKLPMIPPSKLPSYVDDVLEYATFAGFPASGETGKIYIDIATSITYRWSGSLYVPIGKKIDSTTDVPEGDKLYFTTDRAKAATVVDTLVGDEDDLAPSVSAVNDVIEDLISGPDTGTNNSIVIWDETTGRAIKTTSVVINGNVMTGLQGLTSSGLMTSTGNQIAMGTVTQVQEANTAQSGANVILANPTKPTVRLEGAITSISGIADSSPGRMITLINQTGASITVNNNTGSTAENRILTGTKASLTLTDEASIILKYDGTEQRWMVIGGSSPSSVSSSTRTPTIQRFISGASNYTTPADVKYIILNMVGGGAGGYGGGTTNGGNPGAGVASTFGSISAGGGAIGSSQTIGGSGGTNTVGVGTVLVDAKGGGGGGGAYSGGSALGLGTGAGGNSFFGGGGLGVASFNPGQAGAVNTGGGGSGGGGSNAVSAMVSGSGGGAGGFVRVLIAPTAGQVFAYSVGTSGSNGIAGANGAAGGAGGSGLIVVEEYY